MMEEGIPQFYAEIHTPDSIKLTYAPEGRCLGCNAKLSKYRNFENGDWERWCSACQRKGIYELQCESCWETFPSYGTRIICAKCLVPSVRIKRREQAVERAENAVELHARYGWSLEKIVDKFNYNSVIELERTMERFSILVQESDEY